MRKMGLRKALFGVGLSGLLSASALAEDKELPTLRETSERMKRETIPLTDSNFKREVLDYNGATLVQMYSSCYVQTEADNIDRNMQFVYLQLAEKFKDAQVNSLPLKFTSYDGCNKVAETGKVLYDKKVTGIETHMYLDGREIDRRRGGPTDISKTEGNVKAMSDWITSNLQSTPIIYQDEKKRLIFNGEFKPQLIAYEQ